MPYVRLSLLVSLEEHRDEVHRLERELLDFLAGLPGFRDGYLLTSTDESPEVGRVVIWENGAAADHAANHDHVLAIRARLLQITEEDRLERSFNAARHDAS